MSHSLQSPELLKDWQQQLFLLSNEKSRFLDEHFPQQGKERQSMELLLSQYTAQIEKLAACEGKGPAPVVIIGCSLTLEYLDYQTTDQFTIVLPQDANPDEGKISFLSPVGRQLLLAAAGDVLSVTTPAGSMQVRIESIQY